MYELSIQDYTRFSKFVRRKKTVATAAPKNPAKLFFHPKRQRWILLGPKESMPKVRKPTNKDQYYEIPFYNLTESEIKGLMAEKIAKPSIKSSPFVVALAGGMIGGGLWMLLSSFALLGPIGLLVTPLLLSSFIFPVYSIFALAKMRTRTGRFPNRYERNEIWRKARNLTFELMAGVLGWTLGSIIAPFIVPVTVGAGLGFVLTAFIIGISEAIPLACVNFMNELSLCENREDRFKLIGDTARILLTVPFLGATWYGVSLIGLPISIGQDLLLAGLNALAISAETYIFFRAFNTIQKKLKLIFKKFEMSNPEDEIEKNRLLDPKMEALNEQTMVSNLSRLLSGWDGNNTPKYTSKKIKSWKAKGKINSSNQERIFEAAYTNLFNKPEKKADKPDIHYQQLQGSFMAIVP